MTDAVAETADKELASNVENLSLEPQKVEKQETKKSEF